MTEPVGNYKHFDLEFLRDIADQDDFMMTEIVSSFLINNPKNLAELELAILNGNADGAVQFATHKLVGAYSLVGASQLAAIAKYIETVEDAGVLSHGLAELKEKSTLLFEELRHLLAQTNVD